MWIRIVKQRLWLIAYFEQRGRRGRFWKPDPQTQRGSPADHQAHAKRKQPPASQGVHERVCVHSAAKHILSRLQGGAWNRQRLVGGAIAALLDHQRVAWVMRLAD